MTYLASAALLVGTLLACRRDAPPPQADTDTDAPTGDTAPRDSSWGGSGTPTYSPTADTSGSSSTRTGSGGTGDSGTAYDPSLAGNQLDQGRPADPADCITLYSAANGYTEATNAKQVQADCAGYGLSCSEPFITYEAALCLTEVELKYTASGYLGITDTGQYPYTCWPDSVPGPYAAAWRVYYQYKQRRPINYIDGVVLVDAITGEILGESVSVVY